MKTITQHLDDLDRMIDAGNTPKHELRSQVAFIGREVAALEADYARLAEAHQNAVAERNLKIKELESKIALRDSGNSTLFHGTVSPLPGAQTG